MPFRNNVVSAIKFNETRYKTNIFGKAVKNERNLNGNVYVCDATRFELFMVANDVSLNEYLKNLNLK